MAKFYIHAFHKERIKYEVEAENIEAAANMFEEVIGGCEGLEVEREVTGEFCNDFLVDPILEDGTVDYENAKWYPEEDEA